MFLGGLLAVAMVSIGLGLSTFAGVPLRGEERLAIAVPLGIGAVAACSFVYFLAAGMSPATLAFGLAAPGAAAIVGVRRAHRQLRGELRNVVLRLQLPWRDRRSLRPAALLTVAAGAVATRVLALAYQHDETGIATGSLAGWGDWAAHLAYSGSFAYGDNRQLDLPLASGWPLRYHFLANYVGALYAATGLTLTRALVISAWLVAVVIVPLMFAAVERLAGSRLVAGIAVVVFILTGGVGAWYFVTVDVAERGWRVLAALPQTYARMPEHDLWVDNTISASLYAQRSTLYGIALGLAALIVLLAARPRRARRGFVVAGLLVGITGITFVHMLFTGLALGAFAARADRHRARRVPWRWFLATAAVVGLPLAAAIRPPTDSLRWLVGWMAPAADQSWLWFWIRNTGIFLPLLLVATVAGLAPPRLRRLSAPLWLWFVVPNIVAFHPSEWNNTKFFVFWQWSGSVVIAAVIARLAAPALRRRRASGTASDGPPSAPVRHLRVGGRRTLALGGAALLVAALTVTGGLDTVRAMQRASAIPWVTVDDVAAGEWLRANRIDGDVLVYSASNTSAVAALSGVPAVSGYPGWTADLGLPDAALRYSASRAILAGTADALALAARYGVTVVAIGPRERWEAGASDSFWTVNGTLVFVQGDYRLYRVGPPPAVDG